MTWRLRELQSLRMCDSYGAQGQPSPLRYMAVIYSLYVAASLRAISFDPPPMQIAGLVVLTASNFRQRGGSEYCCGCLPLIMLCYNLWPASLRLALDPPPMQVAGLVKLTASNFRQRGGSEFRCDCLLLIMLFSGSWPASL